MTFTPKQFEKFETKLIQLGYTKYAQDFKMSDFVYWKGFEKEIDEDSDKRKGYSVGFAVYDWSKYPQFTQKETFLVALEFILGNNDEVDRLDLTISDNRITIERFEEFCKKFYNFYKENKL